MHEQPGPTGANSISVSHVQEMQQIGGKQFSVVFFNANVQLPAIPDTTFMQQLHTGLDFGHRRQLQVLKPTPLTHLIRVQTLFLVRHERTNETKKADGQSVIFQGLFVARTCTLSKTVGT